MAAVALAVLDVHVPAGVFQAAIFERAVDKYSVIENQVLVFEDFIFVASHGWFIAPEGGLAPRCDVRSHASGGGIFYAT